MLLYIGDRFFILLNQYVLRTPTMLLYTGLSHARTNTYYVHPQCCYIPVCHTLEPIRITYTHNIVIYRFVTRQNQYVLRTPTMLLYTVLSHARTNTYYVHPQCRYIPVCHTLEPIRITYTHNVVIYRFVTHQNQYVLRTPTMLLYTGLSHTRTNTYYVHPQCCYIPVCHTLEPIRITYTHNVVIHRFVTHQNQYVLRTPQCYYIPVCHTLEPIRITYTHNVVIYRFVTHQNQYVLRTPTILLYTGLSHARTNTYYVHPQCCYIPFCHTLEPIRITYTHNVVIYRFVIHQNQYVLRTPTMLLYTGLSHTRTNTYYVHPQCCYIPVCHTLEPIRITYTHNVAIYRFVTRQNQYVLRTPTMLLYTGLSHTRTNTYYVHHNVVIYRFVTHQNQYVLRTPTMLLYTGLSHTRTNTYYVHPQCCYIPVCHTLEPIRITYTHNVVIYRFVTHQNQYVLRTPTMLLYTSLSHTRTNTYYVHPQCCYIPVCHTLEPIRITYTHNVAIHRFVTHQNQYVLRTPQCYYTPVCHTLEPIRITYTHNVVIYRFVTHQNQYVLRTPTMLLYTGLSHARTNTYYVHPQCCYIPVCHTLEPIRITYTHNVAIYRFVTRQNQYVLCTPTMLLYTGLSDIRTNTYYIHPQCCYIPVCHTLEPIRITYTHNVVIYRFVTRQNQYVLRTPTMLLYTGLSHSRTNTYYVHPQCCYIPVCHTLEPIRITYTHNVVIYRFVTLEPIRITYTHNVVIYRFVTRQNEYVLCTPTMLLYTGLSHTRTNTYYVHPQCCYIPVCHTLESIRITYTHNVVIYRFFTHQNQYVLRTPTMLLYTGLSHTRTNTYYVHPQCCYIPVCHTLEPIRITDTHNVVIYRFITHKTNTYQVHPQCCYIPVCHTLEPIRISYTHNVVIYRFVTHQNQYVLRTPTMLLYTGLSHTRTNTYYVHPQCCYIPSCHTLEPIRITYTHNVVIYRFVTHQNQYVLRTPTMLLYTGFSHTRTNTYYVHPQCCYIPVCHTLEPIRITYTHNVVIYRFVTRQNQYVLRTPTMLLYTGLSHTRTNTYQVHPQCCYIPVCHTLEPIRISYTHNVVIYRFVTHQNQYVLRTPTMLLYTGLSHTRTNTYYVHPQCCYIPSCHTLEPIRITYTIDVVIHRLPRTQTAELQSSKPNSIECLCPRQWRSLRFRYPCNCLQRDSSYTSRLKSSYSLTPSFSEQTTL